LFFSWLWVELGSSTGEEGMTAIDPEFEWHRRTWIGFTRLLKYAIAIIVIILVGMAIFLL
jgi:Bacterial aa3 type cytochrome c oxidase subunit IV